METKELIDLLKSCDKALTSCKANTDAKDYLINTQNKHLDLYKQHTTELEQSNGGGGMFWFVLGALAGTLVTGVIIGVAK